MLYSPGLFSKMFKYIQFFLKTLKTCQTITCAADDLIHSDCIKVYVFKVNNAQMWFIHMIAL